MRKILPAILLLSWAPAYAQLASTTSLVGNVSDTAGAAVQGAPVTATNLGTSETLSAITGASGYYEFLFIRPGTYSITVKQSGFEALTKTGIAVANNQVVRNDFTLKVGQVSESVVVTAEIPAINTEDASLRETLSTKSTAELPLNSRNALKLAITVPTVIQGRKSPAGNPGGGEGFIGAGTREIQNSMSMDGVSIMNNLITTTTFRPSVDAIEAFQVQTGTYSAQYGGYMGVQLNVVTKSGTNELHGAVFEFLRNNALDARGFFERPEIKQAPLRQNQFGFALTGPVVIPKLYDGRNRTFFLANYEGLRNRQASAGLDTVLTPEMRNGNFSQITTPIVDPLTAGRTPFAGNIIPPSRLSPQALRALAYMPLPNVAGTRAANGGPVNNYNVNIPNTQDGNQTINRIDQSIGENARLFGRYAWANNTLLNGNTNPFNGYNQPVKDRNFVFAYTQVVSPTIVNDMRFGRQHTKIDSLNFFNTPELADATTQIGIPGFTSDINNAGLPNLGITGFMPIGGQNMASSNWYQNDSTTQFSDVLSINRGAHSLSIGYEVRRVATSRVANNNPRGGFTFSGTISEFAGADFMLGLPLNVTTPGPAVRGRVGQYRHGFFISDNWKATPRLTLTLGLRYDLPTVPKAFNGNARILNPEQTAFIPETVPQTIPLIDPLRKNFGPRFGFAYRATDKWVLRGGYGIYFNANQLNSYTLMNTNPPFSTIFTYNATPANPNLSLANPTPSDALAGASPRPNAVTLNPDLPNAYMNQWSFSIERALWRNAAFDIQYLGSHMMHLDRSYFNNTPAPGPGSIDARRPNPLFGVIRTIQNDMIANYEGLSVVFRQQLAHGLAMNASYTWSKTLDVSTDSNGGGAPMDPYNWRLDYGHSNWDLPHRFVASWTYEIPLLRGSTNPFIKTVIANWQANGIITLQSGFPFNVTATGDRASTGAGNQRPDLVKPATADCGNGKLTNCIDASAFATPAQYTYGNAGRNILRGPGLTNIDFSLFKNVPIGERVKIQIRGEAFNVSNTPGFASPNAVFGTPAFGTISGLANNNRQIQLGAKILF